MYRSILILLLTAAALRWPTAHGQIPDVASPLVSYQFHDSLSDVPGQPNVVSPLVSYQFFDWLGDENVDFASSPLVSYYFNGPPRILTQPVSQLARVGSNVTLSVAADGTQPLTYQWRFNGQPLANTNGAAIALDNLQSGDAGVYSVVVSNISGSVTSADARLIVYEAPLELKPAVPALLATSQTLSEAQTAQPRVPGNSQLKVLVGTTVDPNKMTIVMTHGWNSNSGNWPTSMAGALSPHYASQANILAWDWEADAKINPLNPAPSAGRTPSQGTALANALMETLEPGYNKPIHFLGHSLGTLVNCVAADYLHGDRRPSMGEIRSNTERYSSANTHMTLFDEAELAVPVNAIKVSADVLLGNYDLKNGQVNSVAKVIPSSAAYVDNYVSEVGLLHDKAVNVLLWRRLAVMGISDIPGFGEGLHGYGYEWYRQSILSPSSSIMGFFWSFERGSISTNPYSATPQSNTFYIQSLDLNQSFLNVSRLNSATAQLLSRSRLVVYPTLQSYQGLNAIGTTIQGVYLAGIEHAGTMLVNFVETFGVPTGTPVYSDTAVSTPAYFLSESEKVPANLNASWDLQFSIQLGDPLQQQLPPGVEAMPVPYSSGGPVYTIIPVQVPNEAVGVSFEYNIRGSAVDEFMTMGINSSNEYTMEAKFLDEGAWNSTPVIPVSDLRNQEVNLVFALNGISNSPTGILSVRNIQFYIPPRPRLNLDKSGNTLVASWPLSAIDWTIETSTDLSDPNGWEAVTQPPTASDFFHTMTFDVSGTDRAFFRLKK